MLALESSEYLQEGSRFSAPLYVDSADIIRNLDCRSCLCYVYTY